MATTTTSMRVEEEQLDKFNQIKGSFEKGSDFANWIIQAHKMHQASHSEEVFAADAAELEKIFRRAVTIFNNAGDRTRTLLSDKDFTIKQELELKDLKTLELEDELQAARADFTEQKALLNEATAQIKSLSEEIAKNNKDIIKLAKELETAHSLNEMLSDVKQKCINIEETNTKLISEKAELEKTAAAIQQKQEKLEKELEEEKKDHSYTIRKYEEAVALLKERHSEKIENLTEKHSSAIEIIKMEAERAVEKITTEKELEIIEINKSNQAEVKLGLMVEKDLREKIQEQEHDYMIQIEKLKNEIADFKSKLKNQNDKA